MIRSEAVARVQQGLGFRTDLAAVIVSALQQAQSEFEGGQTLPWFLLEEDDELTLAADTHVVAHPTGYIRLYEDAPVYYLTNSTPREIGKIAYGPGLAAYSGRAAGAPVAFAERATSFHFFPLADAEYPIYVTYYKAADLLAADDTENIWLQKVPYRLIGRAGQIVADDLQHSDASRKFAELYAYWTAWLLRETAAREEAGMQRRLGKGL